MMRWLTLYARSRRLPLAVLVSIGAVALVWGGWGLFTDRREINESLALMTVLLALAPLIPTMAGDDDSLESGAALPWPPRRALHVLAFAALACVPLLASAATGAWFGPPGTVLRNVAALTGLIALSVALAGIRMAWQLPLCWTVLQMLFGGLAEPGWKEAPFLLLQPAGSETAAVTAIVLFAAGVLAYAWRAGPRVAPAEVAFGQ
ncbi:hypothetical protein [Paractinoplanes lichenicola]|uniref:ABC transporter permease n=1 Tax=Paractinoplanes lichenicola TaxID=2802976 RepID=A0ABS1VVY8_9ACTN|nr:hypothetical protein [Actinoplanes lichenicola]MBL7258627.1 hypothetical protein [Actinoplanes lichenicola]